MNPVDRAEQLLKVAAALNGRPAPNRADRRAARRRAAAAERAAVRTRR